MDFYERTGTFLLYKDLQARDFAWNFNVINIIAPEIVEIPETDLGVVFDFLDEHLFSYYSDAYMKDLFPYRVPLAQSVMANNRTSNFMESEGSILLSDLTREFVGMPDAQQLTYVRSMHNVFLNLAAKKLERKLEEDFFKLSDVDCCG